MNTEESLSEIRLVVSQFKTPGVVLSVLPFGSGLINDSFLVHYETGESTLLQKINHSVFPDVNLLMSNIVLVTAHLKEQIRRLHPDDHRSRTMLPIETCSGNWFVQDAQGRYWRMLNYLANTRSYDLVQSARQAYEGGRAFGEFQYMLSDLDPSSVQETIPHFHNIEDRLRKFRKSVLDDAAGRVKDVMREIEAIEERAAGMNSISRKGKQGLIPKRVVHSDTKFNNVLLDNHDKARCVIDLDTVMPGYAAFDFGDAIRTIINTADEDEADLEKIKTNIEYYKAFTEGFLEETSRFLTTEEVNTLPEGALLFPYMQAVRFLTDYLDGDVYYKTRFAEHNVQRTKAQLQLLFKMEERYDELKSIVTETAARMEYARTNAYEKY